MTLATRNAETYEVYLADELHSDLDDWTYAPAVIPIRLELKALPGIDVAKFVYHVGTFVEHFDGLVSGIYNPLAALARSYIRIRIYDNNPGPTAIYDWAGVIDRKSVAEISGGSCSGDQEFVAFGLMHELGKHVVTTSKVAPDFTTASDASAITIGRAIPFNGDDRIRHSAAPGNRHYYDTVHENSRIFSRSPDASTVDPVTGPPAKPWLASEAIEYTLAHDAPSEIQWTLNGQTEALDAKPPQVERDRRTVAAILHDLVGRNNGVLARLQLQDPGVDDDPDRLVAAITIKSAADTAFSVGTFTMPANDSQISLITTNAIDVETLEISESGFESYDQIIYEGHWITTAATLSLGNDLYSAWTDDDQDALVEADPASGEPDLKKRAKAADEFRSRDSLAHVFRRFILATTSIQPAFDNAGSATYNLAPDPAEDLDDDSDIANAYDSGPALHDVWRKTFLAAPDPDVPENERRVLCLFPVTDGIDLTAPPDYENEVWQYGDRLTTTGGDATDRRFTVNATPDRITGFSELDNHNHTAPGIYLNVSGGPQWLIASVEMADAAHLSPTNDPANRDVRGLQWNQCVVTVAIEADGRVAAAYPPTAVGIGNLPPRIKRVQIPDGRLDIALPGTVCGIDDSGSAVRVPTTGSIWRDDRPELLQLAQADYTFSGPDHRTVSFSYAQLNPFNLELGSLITTVQTSCGTDTCNTLVSSLVFDFKSLTVECQTSFEEIDVVKTFATRLGRPLT